MLFRSTYLSSVGRAWDCSGKNPESYLGVAGSIPAGPIFIFLSFLSFPFLFIWAKVIDLK